MGRTSARTRDTMKQKVWSAAGSVDGRVIVNPETARSTAVYACSYVSAPGISALPQIFSPGACMPNNQEIGHYALRKKCLTDTLSYSVRRIGWTPPIKGPCMRRIEASGCSHGRLTKDEDQIESRHKRLSLTIAQRGEQVLISRKREQVEIDPELLYNGDRNRWGTRHTMLQDEVGQNRRKRQLVLAMQRIWRDGAARITQDHPEAGRFLCWKLYWGTKVTPEGLVPQTDEVEEALRNLDLTDEEWKRATETNEGLGNMAGKTVQGLEAWLRVLAVETETASASAGYHRVFPKLSSLRNGPVGFKRWSKAVVEFSKTVQQVILLGDMANVTSNLDLVEAIVDDWYDNWVRSQTPLDMTEVRVISEIFEWLDNRPKFSMVGIEQVIAKIMNALDDWSSRPIGREWMMLGEVLKSGRYQILDDDSGFLHAIMDEDSERLDVAVHVGGWVDDRLIKFSTCFMVCNDDGVVEVADQQGRTVVWVSSDEARNPKKGYWVRGASRHDRRLAAKKVRMQWQETAKIWRDGTARECTSIGAMLAADRTEQAGVEICENSSDFEKHVLVFYGAECMEKIREYTVRWSVDRMVKNGKNMAAIVRQMAVQVVSKVAVDMFMITGEHDKSEIAVLTGVRYGKGAQKISNLALEMYTSRSRYTTTRRRMRGLVRIANFLGVDQKNIAYLILFLAQAIKSIGNFRPEQTSMDVGIVAERLGLMGARDLPEAITTRRRYIPPPWHKG